MKIIENRIALGIFLGKEAYVELIEYAGADFIFLEMLNAPYVDWATI